MDLLFAYLQETSGSNFDIRFRGFDNSGTENISEVIADSIIGVTGRPDITVLSNDQIVVVWRDNPSGDDIQGRVYNSNGTAVGTDFTLVNNPGSSGESSLVALSNGNFGLSYVDSSGNYGFQEFDATGNPPTATGPLFQPFVSGGTTATAIQLTNGNIVAAWENTGDGSGTSIQGAIFQIDGTDVKSEFTLNITTSGNQFQPSLTALADGGFFVVYNSGDTNNSGVFGQRYSADGVAIGEEIVLNSTIAGNQITNRDFGSQVVTQLTTGEIAVTFETGNVDVFTRVFKLPTATPETVTIDLTNFFTATDSDPGDTPAIDQSSIVITADAGNSIQSTTPFAVDGTQITYDKSIFDFLDAGEQETFNIAFNIVSGTDTVARTIEINIDGVTDNAINVIAGTSAAELLGGNNTGTGMPNDILIANGSNANSVGDELAGNGGNDIYLGDANNNLFRTGDDDDVIYPGGGDPLLGKDFIIAREGNDKYVFSGITSGIVAITYAQLGSSLTFDIDASANTGTANQIFGGNIRHSDVFIDVQDIVNANGLELFGSSGGPDTFNINSTSTGSITLFGGLSADIYNLQGGNITLDFGFEGDDGSGPLAVTNASQGAVVDLQNMVITNDGFGNVDTFASGSAAPTEVRGTNQADTFTGSSARDRFFGRDGDDTFVIGGGTLNVIDGGEGFDTVRFDMGGYTGGANVTLSSESVISQFNGITMSATLTSIEGIVGTDFEDVIGGTSTAERFEGNGGDDDLSGNGGADDILGGAGSDVIKIPDLAFNSLDGGTEIDTLIVRAEGQSLDFTSLGTNDIMSLERLNLAPSNVDNIITLDDQNIINFSETRDPFADTLDDNPFGSGGNPLVESTDVLVIFGDSEDTLNLANSNTQAGASWDIAPTGNDQGFDVYNYADTTTTFASVAVEDDVVVNIV